MSLSFPSYPYPHFGDICQSDAFKHVTLNLRFVTRCCKKHFNFYYIKPSWIYVALTRLITSARRIISCYI